MVLVNYSKQFYSQKTMKLDVSKVQLVVVVHHYHYEYSVKGHLFRYF